VPGLTCKDVLWREAIPKVTEVMESPVAVTRYEARTKRRREMVARNGQRPKNNVLLNRDAIYNVPLETNNEVIMADMAEKAIDLKGCPKEILSCELTDCDPLVIAYQF
jgi:hypothetical protein